MSFLARALNAFDKRLVYFSFYGVNKASLNKTGSIAFTIYILHEQYLLLLFFGTLTKREAFLQINLHKSNEKRCVNAFAVVYYSRVRVNPFTAISPQTPTERGFLFVEA